MNRLGPYLVVRALPGAGQPGPAVGGAGPAVQVPAVQTLAIQTLRGLDQVTGMPVLLHVWSQASWPGGHGLLPLPSELTADPHLLLPEELGQEEGQRYAVTPLPPGAAPAQHPSEAAPGALAALAALHGAGLAHGGVSAAQLWQLAGGARLAGVGLPWAHGAQPEDDLLALAQALETLGGLPPELSDLRHPDPSRRLSAAEGLRRLRRSGAGENARTAPDAQTTAAQPGASQPTPPQPATQPVREPAHAPDQPAQPALLPTAPAVAPASEKPVRESPASEPPAGTPARGRRGFLERLSGAVRSPDLAAPASAVTPGAALPLPGAELSPALEPPPLVIRAAPLPEGDQPQSGPDGTALAPADLTTPVSAETAAPARLDPLPTPAETAETSYSVPEAGPATGPQLGPETNEPSRPARAEAPVAADGKPAAPSAGPPSVGEQAPGAPPLATPLVAETPGEPATYRAAEDVVVIGDEPAEQKEAVQSEPVEMQAGQAAAAAPAPSPALPLIRIGFDGPDEPEPLAPPPRQRRVPPTVPEYPGEEGQDAQVLSAARRNRAGQHQASQQLEDEPEIGQAVGTSVVRPPADSPEEAGALRATVRDQPIRIGWDEDDSWRVVKAAPPARRRRPAPRWLAPLLVTLLLLAGVLALLRSRPASVAADCCRVTFNVTGNAPGGVRVRVAQVPAGSRLKAGSVVGTAPGTLNFGSTPGRYTLQLEAEGYGTMRVPLILPRSTPYPVVLK